MTKRPAVIAVDLGGTNMRWALVDRQGTILGRWERTTATMPDEEALITTMAEDFFASVREAADPEVEVTAVGLGVPGRILPEEGMGAGAGYDHILGMTLGTGVGGGLILNGQIWSGTAGTAGEVGHLTIDPEGPRCRCGSRGCLETFASGSWTVAWVKEQLAQKEPSWLTELWEKDPDAIDGQTLVTAAKMGDPLARRAFERVGKALGIAIADVVHLLGLSRVVIGGRFALSWAHFHLPMMEDRPRCPWPRPNWGTMPASWGPPGWPGRRLGQSCRKNPVFQITKIPQGVKTLKAESKHVAPTRQVVIPA